MNNMAVTAKMIVASLRSELALNVPDHRATDRMIADAIEALDNRIDNLESRPAEEVRHGESPEVRGRRRK